MVLERFVFCWQQLRNLIDAWGAHTAKVVYELADLEFVTARACT
jgi:hypothetical protein